MKLLWVVLVGYIFGCFPTAVLYSRLIKHDDIRNHGSGNPGTSNVIRTFGVRAGAFVLLGDMLKGTLAAAVGYWIMGNVGMYYGGISAVLGHDWPIILKFKGGKGVATTMGALLVIMPLWTLLGCLLFVLVTLITRFFSVGSMSAITFLWLISIICYTTDVGLVFFVTLAMILVYYNHRENLKRLRAGTENKLSVHS